LTGSLPEFRSGPYTPELRSGLYVAITLAVTLLVLTGCRGQGGPSLFAHGSQAGYVDLEQVINAHPLHVELDQLQAQITLLNGQSQNAPQPQTQAQAQALAQMEADLAAAEQQFQQSIGVRRAYYEQREAVAVSELQNQASGSTGPIGAQFGQAAQKIQADALKAYVEYQKQLFAADDAHLRQVALQLQQEVGLKVNARRTQLEKQETDYQISLAKQSQTQRLNLKTKLEDLSLPNDERAQYTSQLSNIETREEALINQLKTKDNADLKSYADSLQRDAAARYNAAKTTALAETKKKMEDRQKQTNDQLRKQLAGIGGQYQKQVQTANAAIQKDPKLRAQIEKIHNENQGAYSVEFQKALAAYQLTRRSLVAKYSAVGHMQFQDNQELAAEAQQIADQRRALYEKIVDQVRAQTADVARAAGVSLVLSNIRGAGSAVDLTPQVEKAIAALPAVVPSPSPSAATGS
jgi:hypothetical protein